MPCVSQEFLAHDGLCWGCMWKLHVYYLHLPRLIATGILIDQRAPKHGAAALLAALCACLLERGWAAPSELGAEVIKAGDAA